MINFDCEKIILTDKEEGVITKFYTLSTRKNILKETKKLLSFASVEETTLQLELNKWIKEIDEDINNCMHEYKKVIARVYIKLWVKDTLTSVDKTLNPEMISEIVEEYMYNYKDANRDTVDNCIKFIMQYLQQRDKELKDL